MNKVTSVPMEANPKHIEININNLCGLSETIFNKLNMLQESLSPILSSKVMSDEKLDLLELDDSKSNISNRLSAICNLLVECDVVIVNISKRLEI